MSFKNVNPISIRIDSRTEEQLTELSKVMEISKSRVIKLGIKLLYEAELNPDFNEDMMKLILDIGEI